MLISTWYIIGKYTWSNIFLPSYLYMPYGLNFQYMRILFSLLIWFLYTSYDVASCIYWHKFNAKYINLEFDKFIFI